MSSSAAAAPRRGVYLRRRSSGRVLLWVCCSWPSVRVPVTQPADVFPQAAVEVVGRSKAGIVTQPGDVQPGVVAWAARIAAGCQAWRRARDDAAQRIADLRGAGRAPGADVVGRMVQGF